MKLLRGRREEPGNEASFSVVCTHPTQRGKDLLCHFMLHSPHTTAIHYILMLPPCLFNPPGRGPRRRARPNGLKNFRHYTHILHTYLCIFGLVYVCIIVFHIIFLATHQALTLAGQRVLSVILVLQFPM